MASIPSNAPVPALLWSYDDPLSGWVVLAFQDIEGWLPSVPWRDQDLARVVVLMEELASCLTPAPAKLIRLNAAHALGSLPSAMVDHAS